MFDLYENVVDLAASKKTGGSGGSVELPFGETPRGTENLFKGITEYPNFDNGEGSGIFFLKDPKLNLYKSYDIIIRGDVYANVPCEETHNYYDFAVWGDMSFSKYPFALEACWIDPYNPIWDEDGNWVGAYGNVAYWAYPQIVVDTTKYPDLKPEEIEIYEPASITKMSGKYVEGMGYEEPEKIAFIENFAINAPKDNYQTPSRTGINVPYDFEPGKNYTVIFDGVEYEVTATYDGLDVILGGIYAENLPFMIGYGADSDAFGVSVRDKGEHTLSVFGIVDVARHIQKKFIPPLAGFLYYDPDNSGYFYSDPELANALGMLDIVSMLKQGPVYICSNVDGKTINKLVVEWDYSYYESFGGYGLDMKTHDETVHQM